MGVLARGREQGVELRQGELRVNEKSGPLIPIERLINRSGFPFQIAVEHAVRDTESKHGWQVLFPEFPWSKGFIDLVLHRQNLIATIECKRVESQTWIFLVEQGASNNETRCRLEWYNSHAPPKGALNPHSFPRLFCSEFTMCEGSYESEYCVIPKGKGPLDTLEPLCREVLGAAHDIGDFSTLTHHGEIEYLVPIIVTNAALAVCELDHKDINLDSGELTRSAMRNCDFVRFRKSLVARDSQMLRTIRADLAAWARDRVRTVFIVRAEALPRFLLGFRAFSYAGPGVHPPEYVDFQSWLRGQ
jgi:hypothetical protein